MDVCIYEKERRKRSIADETDYHYNKNIVYDRFFWVVFLFVSTLMNTSDLKTLLKTFSERHKLFIVISLQIISI